MILTVETTVVAPLAEVWRAYTTPADICQWNAASPDWHTTSATVALRESGAFSSRMEARDGSEGFDFAGVYTRVEPLRCIEYAFGDRKARVDFDAVADAVRVRVAFDPENEFPAEMQQAGWQAILDSFARHVAAQGV